MPIDADLIDRGNHQRPRVRNSYGTNAFFGVKRHYQTRARPERREVSGEASSFNTYRSRLSYGNKFSNGLEMLLRPFG